MALFFGLDLGGMGVFGVWVLSYGMATAFAYDTNRARIVFKSSGRLGFLATFILHEFGG